jgi:hypothetical protein
MVAAPFSAEDALALAVAEQCFASLKHTAFYNALSRCRENVIANLSVSQRKRLTEKADRLSLAASSDLHAKICDRQVASLWSALNDSTAFELNGSPVHGSGIDGNVEHADG